MVVVVVVVVLTIVASRVSPEAPTPLSGSPLRVGRCPRSAARIAATSRTRSHRTLVLGGGVVTVRRLNRTNTLTLFSRPRSLSMIS